MSRRKVNYLNEYSENNFNCIFGIFEMIGSIESSNINKEAQDETNRQNYAQWFQEMQYKKNRDKIADERYAEELAYNRDFAEENRDYNRAFAQEEQAYQRQLQQQIFEREDTALERQASQLSELGINPASQQLNGLGAGSVVSQSQAPQNVSAPVQPNHSVSDIPPQFRAQAFTNFALQGLEPSLEFLNQLNGVKTNNIQRDLIRQEVNKQKLENIASALRNAQYAREYGLQLNDDGTVTYLDTDYNNSVAFKKEEYKQTKSKTRSADAQARIDEEEAYFREHYGSHNKFSDPMSTAEKTATRMKNTLENEIDNGSDDDSLSTTFEDRVNQVGDDMLSTAFAPFTQSKFVRWLNKKYRNLKALNNSINDSSTQEFLRGQGIIK